MNDVLRPDVNFEDLLTYVEQVAQVAEKDLIPFCRDRAGILREFIRIAYDNDQTKDLLNLEYIRWKEGS